MGCRSSGRAPPPLELRTTPFTLSWLHAPPVCDSKAVCLPPRLLTLLTLYLSTPLSQVAAQQLPPSMGGAGPAASTKKNVRQAQDLPIYSVGEWGELSSRRPCSNIHTKA